MRFSSFRQLPVDAAEFWQVHGDARPSGRAFFRKDAGFPSTINWHPQGAIPPAIPVEDRSQKVKTFPLSQVDFETSAKTRLLHVATSWFRPSLSRS